MNPQWSPYVESSPANRQARYAPQNLATPQQTNRDANTLPPVKAENYASQQVPVRGSSVNMTSPTDGQNRAVTEYNGDGDGDVAMEDADAFNKPKYGSRPSHQQRLSQQFIQQEESAAARRYSPMNLSPTSPYTAGPTQSNQPSYTSFTPQSQSTAQSPTRTNPYISPPQSYYSPPGTLAKALLLLIY
jgi:dual specificity protein kinase YAK1